MTRMTSLHSCRLARVALFAGCAALVLGMVAAPARADDRDGRPGPGHPGPDRGRPGPDYGHRGWDHGYYPPPPVAYGGPYYPPPPVVYSPGVGINLPGVSINLR